MEEGVGILASGAAYEQLAFVFGIEVDEGFTREEAGFHGIGAVHSGLFADGEHRLDAPGPVLAFQQGEAGRDAYAVVCPERGVFRHHPAVFDDIGDGVFEEIEGETGQFLTDHVLMGLEHDDGYILLAGSGLPYYADVAGGVAFVFKPVFLGPGTEIIGYRSFIAGTSWNSGNLLENFKNLVCCHVLACIFIGEPALQACSLCWKRPF